MNDLKALLNIWSATNGAHMQLHFGSMKDAEAARNKILDEIDQIALEESTDNLRSSFFPGATLPEGPLSGSRQHRLIRIETLAGTVGINPSIVGMIYAIDVQDDLDLMMAIQEKNKESQDRMDKMSSVNYYAVPTRGH